MSNILLLIDDKKSFKDAFQIISQRKGYQLAWGKSYEELEEKIKQLHEHICTIILDVKCLIKNDQEIESENFIGSAIIYLTSNFPKIPRVILTGDETALEKVNALFNASKEDVFTKSVEDIEKMFLKIDEHKKNYPTRMYNETQLRIRKAIDEGEGKKVEFKSTLFYNIREKKKDEKIVFTSLKNIAAFLNSEGGTLLVGVTDDKTILGLEAYDYPLLKEGDKQDLFKLQLDNLIQANFNDGIQRVLDVTIVKIEGKSVCEIRIRKKFSSPIYITKKVPNKPKKKAFYIRRLSSAIELNKSNTEEYIREHWFSKVN